MSGTEQVQWLMIAFATVMIVVGLWMKHGMDKLNRRIADAEQQQSLSPRVHPAE